MDFSQYWASTDAVSKTLFFILFALSIISWIVGLVRITQSCKMGKTIAEDLAYQVEAATKKFDEASFDKRKTAVEQTLLQQIARYRFDSERGLAMLGTTAAIAPFIGLFGTVWGIFHALHSIAKSNQAGLAQVAGPVGEALVMTGLGLAVAIPAVIFYNLATRANRKVLHVANDTAHELLAKTAN